MSIVEDQVKYLRSIGTQTTYIGESKMKNQEILNRERAFSVAQKPGIIHRGQEIQGNVLYAVLAEKKSLQLFVMRYMQLFIGKCGDLFARKVTTLNSLWGC